jgi:hypothetical protein
LKIDNAQLEELMQSNQLTVETRLYRYPLPEFVASTGDSGIVEISANDDPSEAVTDVYGQGHATLAVHIGAGLAFAESRDNDWRSAERHCVELRLGDALEQGGLIYPVESITTERVWYVTLPQGKIRVRDLGAS